MSDKQPILITGANGLLASRLVQKLASKYTVHAMVYRQPDTTIADVQYHMVDLAGEWSTGQLPRKMFAVLHVAQSSRYKEFPESAMDVFYVNTESTAKLLDYSVRSQVSKFIYFSTGGIYLTGPDPVVETSPLHAYNTLNYHFASKFCGEILTSTYASKFQTTIFRPFFIYGAGQRRSMLIPRLVDQIKNGKPITFDGTEGLRINPIHVNDACAVVAASLEKGSTGLFNLAGPEVLSLKKICDVIASKTGIPAIVEHLDRKPADLIASIEKMSSQLYTPVTRFEQGVADII